MRTAITCLHCGKLGEEVQRSFFLCLRCPEGIREALLHLFRQVERLADRVEQ